MTSHRTILMNVAMGFAIGLTVSVFFITLTY